MKKALITGITGQDGSYLSELLLEKGYEVYGMHRRSSIDEYFYRIGELEGKINLVCADLLDAHSLNESIGKIKPDEIYNLGAQSHVRVSFDQPNLTKEINWLGVERLIDAIKEYSPQSKLYQASTSEMFGEVVQTPQNENTPFNPVSPYAKSKVYAHRAVQRERENGLFGCCGILFNHESPKRGIEFVTRKFTEGVARIKLGLPQRVTGKDYLEMGNLDSKRDWGFARDYVEAMWKMMQHEKPDDYVIATGETHSVREFIELAAYSVGIRINWRGSGKDETGYDTHGKKIIAIDEKFFRPNEVNLLLGDATKAKNILGWEPKVKFEELVEMMVESDLKLLEQKNK